MMETEVFARHIIPVDSSPLKNGLISISGGKITGLETLNRPRGRGRGRHIIIPGLVNAHTHLDLTDMAGEEGRGAPFTEWIKKVIAWRKNRTEDEISLSVKHGINLSIQSGTTCFGDYSSSGSSLQPLNSSGVKGRVFMEVTGISENAAPERISALKTLLSSFKKFKYPVPGIAPHAPYSASPGLIRACSAMARKEGIPISMHAGEVLEEIEFLRGQDGEMARLLKSLNVLDDTFTAPLKNPVEYLRDIGVLDGMALVHLNFISPAEIRLLGKSGCAAIFCPGSQVWFNRKRVAPIMNLLDAGVNIALGSDGLSSNDSLSMFREMRLVKKMFPGIPCRGILEMATINGAAALSLDHVAGSLAPGKDADLAGIDCPETVHDPIKFLFGDNVSVSFVMVKGRVVYGSLR